MCFWVLKNREKTVNFFPRRPKIVTGFKGARKMYFSFLHVIAVNFCTVMFDKNTTVYVILKDVRSAYRAKEMYNDVFLIHCMRLFIKFKT